MSVAKMGTYSASQRESLAADNATLRAGLKKYGTITAFQAATGATPKTAGMDNWSQVRQTNRLLNGKNVQATPVRRGSGFKTSNFNGRDYAHVRVSSKSTNKSTNISRDRQKSMKISDKQSDRANMRGNVRNTMRKNVYDSGKSSTASYLRSKRATTNRNRKSTKKKKR